jgi:hypothetical protein
MSEEIRQDAAEVTAAEATLFEEYFEEISSSPELADIEPEEIEDEVKLAGVEAGAESVYRVIDIRGRFCPADSNWASQEKTLGHVTHYNGPETPARAWSDPLAWIKFISDLHAETGRFSPGWWFNGSAYHEFYFNDVVYLVRNYRAVLPHCGNTQWNFNALAGHVAIGGNQRANAATLRTMTARVSDHLAAMGLPRSRAVGHQEVGPSACPGTLMSDFVRPFRAGQNPGGGSTPTPQPTEPVKATKFYFLYGGERDRLVARAAENALRSEGIAPARVGAFGVPSDPQRGGQQDIEWASNAALDGRLGEYPTTFVGKPVLQYVPKRVQDSFGVSGQWYAKSVSDLWDGLGKDYEDTKNKVSASLAEIAKREKLDAAKVEKRYREAMASPAPEPPEDRPPEAEPQPLPKAKVIDDYFRSLRPAWGHIPYENVGQIILDEAKRAGLAPEAACALIEQESAGRPVMGCDHGRVGDRPPYCHQQATRERVQALIRHIRAGGGSNGVSWCQLTYPPFIYEAEGLGGAHLPAPNMRVGFKLLADYFGKYGTVGGAGAYNRGERARNDATGQRYARALLAKRDAWYRRLA